MFTFFDTLVPDKGLNSSGSTTRRVEHIFGATDTAVQVFVVAIVFCLACACLKMELGMDRFSFRVDPGSKRMHFPLFALFSTVPSLP